MKTRTLAAVAVAIVAATAMFAAACSDDADSNSSAQQGDVEAISARVQRNEMLYAIQTLSTLGLHEIDEGLNDSGVVDPEYVPATRTAVRLLALTNWDATLKSEADAVHADGVALLKALEDADVAAAAELAGTFHDSEHEFDESVWKLLAADLPADAGGVEEHDDDAGATPAAGESPAAGETPDGGDDEATPAGEATP